MSVYIYIYILLVNIHIHIQIHSCLQPGSCHCHATAANCIQTLFLSSPIHILYVFIQIYICIYIYNIYVYATTLRFNALQLCNKLLYLHCIVKYDKWLIALRWFVRQLAAPLPSLLDIITTDIDSDLTALLICVYVCFYYTNVRMYHFLPPLLPLVRVACLSPKFCLRFVVKHASFARRINERD